MTAEEVKKLIAKQTEIENLEEHKKKIQQNFFNNELKPLSNTKLLIANSTTGVDLKDTLFVINDFYSMYFESIDEKIKKLQENLDSYRIIDIRQNPTI